QARLFGHGCGQSGIVSCSVSVDVRLWRSGAANRAQPEPINETAAATANAVVNAVEVGASLPGTVSTASSAMATWAPTAPPARRSTEFSAAAMPDCSPEAASVTMLAA